MAEAHAITGTDRTSRTVVPWKHGHRNPAGRQFPKRCSQQSVTCEALANGRAGSLAIPKNSWLRLITALTY